MQLIESLKLRRIGFHLLSGCVIAAFACINFSRIQHYSQWTDEPYVISRGELSMKVIKSTFGFSAEMTDQEKKELATHFHPPLFSMLNVWVAQLSHKYLKLDSVAKYHVGPIIAAAFLLLFLFLLANKLFGAQIGFFAVLFMALFPRFSAYAQFNSKDVPVAACALAALYCFQLALERRGARDFALSGVFLGGAVASNLNGLFVIPLFLAGIFVNNYLSPIDQKIRIANLVTLFSCFVSTMWIAWPQLWLDPFHFFRAVKHFSIEGSWWPATYYFLWFSQRYSPAEFPWYYIPVNIIITTPILTLILCGLGFLVSFRNICVQKIVPHILLLGLILLPVIARCQTGINRYNEIRHVFLIFPILMIYAGIGLSVLIKMLARREKFIGTLLSTSFALTLFIYLFNDHKKWHPFEDSYFNEAIRIKYPDEIGNHFSWISPSSICRPAFEWLNQNAEINSRVCSPCRSDAYLNILREDLVISCGQEANYATIVSGMLERDLYGGFIGKKSVYSVRQFGSTVFSIVKK